MSGHIWECGGDLTGRQMSIEGMKGNINCYGCRRLRRQEMVENREGREPWLTSSPEGTTKPLVPECSKATPRGVRSPTFPGTDKIWSFFRTGT